LQYDGTWGMGTDFKKLPIMKIKIHHELVWDNTVDDARINSI
jgi:hypothetical protein